MEIFVVWKILSCFDIFFIQTSGIRMPVTSFKSQWNFRRPFLPPPSPHKISTTHCPTPHQTDLRSHIASHNISNTLLAGSAIWHLDSRPLLGTAHGLPSPQTKPPPIHLDKRLATKIQINSFLYMTNKDKIYLIHQFITKMHHI